MISRRATIRSSAAPYGRGSGVPNPIDVRIGKRIRTRRRFLGMTQPTLADALDISFQQVQKYEAGAYRVSASRLLAIAEFLCVPVSFFFGDIDEKSTPPERASRPETAKLIRYYYAIPDEHVRHQFLQMVKAIAAVSK